MLDEGGRHASATPLRARAYRRGGMARPVTRRLLPELAYDVRLDNGQRGILPSRMLRKAPRQ